MSVADGIAPRGLLGVYVSAWGNLRDSWNYVEWVGNRKQNGF